MTQSPLDRIRAAWSQPGIPVILRRGKGHRLRVRLPFAPDNRAWIQNGKRFSPDWISERRHWEIPQAWLNELVLRCLTRFNRLYLIQPFRVQEKCAPACWNAEGHECQCSCMGANHGMGRPDGRWFTVSEAFAARWSHEDYACRLLIANKAA